LHLARKAPWFMMRLAGQAQYRRSRLNSNVRPRNMHVLTSLVLRAMPVLIPLALWSGAPAVGDALSCPVGKTREQCFVLGSDVVPLLSSLWWAGMMLWIPGLVITGILLGYLLRERLPRPWGRRSRPS
jgi:hypothetical protein